MSRVSICPARSVDAVWLRRASVLGFLLLHLLLLPGRAAGQARGRARQVPAQAHASQAGTAGTAQTVAADLSSALREMRSRAGVIFAGRVQAVERNDAAGFVDVRFHVDEAVLGTRPGVPYVLREWAGLWSGEPDRFRVGQRLLLLLTPRGPSGMSSPVNGREGIIPLLPTISAPVADASGAVPVDDGVASSGVAGMAVDLRLVQAGLARAMAADGGTLVASTQAVPAPPLGGIAEPVLGDPDPVTPAPVADPAGWTGPVSPLPAVAIVPGTSGALPPSAAAVLAVLRAGSGLVQSAR